VGENGEQEVQPIFPEDQDRSKRGIFYISKFQDEA
jgi:hypothetical protein